jgi:hypothetical protein
MVVIAGQLGININNIVHHWHLSAANRTYAFNTHFLHLYQLSLLDMGDRYA